MNSTDEGFDQHYNAQVAVDQESLLIVANPVSQAANDNQEAVPTVEAIDERVGKPGAVALDNGYFSEKNIEELEARKIEPYIATGRESHHRSWQDYFAQQPGPPPEPASAKEKMAYRLQTEIGKALYGLGKCTVEPVIGIIKEALGFRQFSLRGLVGARGRAPAAAASARRPYDAEADVPYINFKKPTRATDSEITEEDVIIRHEGNEIIGLTVLHASTR